jgi:hypothetical protein
MCWFFNRKAAAAKDKTRKDNADAKPERSRADDLRKFARATYITPARKKGMRHASFSAAEVKSGFGQGVRLQSVVSAIDAQKFPGFARAKLTKRTEDKKSGDVRWTFEV